MKFYKKTQKFLKKYRLSLAAVIDLCPVHTVPSLIDERSNMGKHKHTRYEPTILL